MKEYRTSMLFLLGGFIVGTLNDAFGGGFWLGLIACIILFCVSIAILLIKKKESRYHSVKTFLFRELDLTILTTGIMLFGLKFILPTPFKGMASIIAMTFILTILLFGPKIKTKINQYY